ncbi:transcriptional regulator ATRX [Achlya hypogyna]|uniref:Transcriptional regulator ATRX n=1 Tax=Achlya hypogyna TaxID=1202772 RepID=A0A1V9ZE76_ACHHY|nr:transcriptional regulator ATRX [Achlya hypogyna]
MEVLGDISDLLVDAGDLPIGASLDGLIPGAEADEEMDDGDDEDASDTEAPEDAPATNEDEYIPDIAQWSSDDEEEEEAEEEAIKVPKSRRKKRLHDILGEDELDEETIKAREMEKERMKRFRTEDEKEDSAATGWTGDGQLCINPLADGSIPTGNIGEDNEPILIHPDISRALKPHQIKGVRFLWSHISIGPKGFGCILADFMGLGKTLQVVATVHTFLSAVTVEDGVKVAKYNSALILAPAICVRNWEAEFKKWLAPHDLRRMGLMTLESDKTVQERVDCILNWQERGGVMVMGYEMYRGLVLQATGEEKIKTNKYSLRLQNQLKDVQEALCAPGPDLIVLDEGHRIRDAKSKLVETKRRIILTGYPLQNHMMEYWTMVNFARPNFLGSQQEFKNRFVDPIENGGFEDSSPEDMALSRKRAYVLTKELSPLVLRRDASYLHAQLPPKHEYVMLCKLSTLQVQIYKAFLREGIPKGKQLKQVDVLGGYHISLAISNHPDVVFNSMKQLNDEGAKDAAAASAGPAPASILDDGGDDSDIEAMEAMTRTMQHRLSFAEPLFPPSYVTGIAENSGKMLMLLHILRACREIGDRVTVFTQSITSMNVIEAMLNEYNTKKKTFEKIHAIRIDGSTPQQLRFKYISQFNDPCEEVDVILISTKAGGEGVNLCGGNRVVIFDVCWNPCHDAQSMCRSYRFGQMKPVYVYRLIAAGTMEKKVYDLQVRKEGVSKRVVDNTALERKFQRDDIRKYFCIHDFKQAQQHTAAVKPDEVLAKMKAHGPKDAVLESLLAEKSKWMVDCFEQDTMFEENLDERISEIEQQEALRQFAMEKACRDISAYSLHASNAHYKRALCSQCNHSNPIDDLDADVASIMCSNCETPIDISTEENVVTVNSSTHQAALATARAAPAVSEAGLALQHQHLQAQYEMYRSINALTGAHVAGLMAGENGMMALAAQGTTARGVSEASRGYVAVARQLPPNLQRFSGPVASSITPPVMIQRPGLRFLFIRKGLNRAVFETLKTQAAKALKCHFEVELTSATTDVISALPLEEVLSWLRRTSLPGFVTYRNVEWLEAEIKAAPAPTP